MDQAYCGAPSGASASEGEATLSTLATMVADAVETSLKEPLGEPERPLP